MKIKRVVVQEEVVEDLNDGKAFYDRREAGVGDYFWDSMLSDIESLLLFAGIHIRMHGFYRMLAKRFPYAIYYDMKEDVAQVIAVLPVRRDPLWIGKKIQEREEGLHDTMG